MLLLVFSKTITLFLTVVLLSSVFTMSYFPESDAVKSKKKICGDKICGTLYTKIPQASIQTNTKTTETNKQIIQLPPYPNEPDVNPGFEEHTQKFSPPKIVKVTDKIYSAVGYGMANSVMVVGDDGIIIIDTMLTYETAKEVMKEFRKISDKPVKAIIYTHSHPDHVNGAGAFAEYADSDLKIYAHSTVVNNYLHESGQMAELIGKRGIFYYGALLPKEGSDRLVNVGIGPVMELGKTAFLYPTDTFDDTLNIEVAGVKMQLINVPSETNDEIIVWMPDLKVLQSAEVL